MQSYLEKNFDHWTIGVHVIITFKGKEVMKTGAEGVNVSLVGCFTVGVKWLKVPKNEANG